MQNLCRNRGFEEKQTVMELAKRNYDTRLFSGGKWLKKTKRIDFLVSSFVSFLAVPTGFKPAIKRTVPEGEMGLFMVNSEQIEL